MPAPLLPGNDACWWLLAGGTAAVAGAATARQARADAIVGGFGDGRSYRRMARGEPGSPPFSRRALGPALARRLGGDGPAAFRRPVTLLHPTQPGYEEFYLPYMHPPMRPRLAGDAARRLAGLGAAAALLATARAVRRARATAVLA